MSDQTPPIGAAAWAALARGLAREAGLPPPDDSDLSPAVKMAESGSVPNSDSSLGRERILHFLGYFDETHNLEAVDEFDAAEERFLGDFRRTPALCTDIDDGEIAPIYDRVAQALRLEVDANLQLPMQGERTLTTRILQAQTVLLGASHGAVGRPFGEDDEFALMSLDRWLGPPEDLQTTWLKFQTGLGDRHALLQPVVNRIGSADRLLNELIARDPAGFLVIPAPGGGTPGDQPLWTRGDGQFATRRGLWDRMLHGDEEVKAPLLQTAFDGQPARVAEDNGNRLALRLVQLKLQQAGFYDATVDGMFGRRSWSALVDAARGADPAAGDTPSMESFYRILPGGRFAALSLRRLVATLLRDEPPLSEAQLRDALLEMPPHGLAGSGTDLLAAEQAAAAARAPVASEDRSIGVFRSVRRVVTGAIEAIRNVLHGTARLVERMLQPIADLLAWLRQKAGHVVNLLREALAPLRRLVFCEPYGDQNAVSHFLPDRDVVFYVDHRAPPDAAARHMRKLQHHIAVLAFSRRLIALMVRIGADAAKGPIGWVGIVIAVVREVPDLIGLGRSLHAA